MRILLVNYEYPPLGGGGGIAHQDLAEALAVRHDVRVLTTRYGTLPRFETRRGVAVHRVPVWGRVSLPTATIRSMVTFFPSALAVGSRLLRTWRPDVINAFFAVPSGLPAVLLGRAYHIPVVLTLVGADVFDPTPTAGIATHRHPFLRFMVRRIIRTATARTAISSDTRRRAIEYHGAPADIEVIPLGLVPPHGAPGTNPPAPFASRNERSSPFRLVAIGRLIPRKAYADLLEAIAQCGRRDIHLHLIGDGPLAPFLRTTAERLGVGDRVTFHGAVDEAEKWRLLFRADCFVSPSLYEGFGMVFLEAMYAGLPIIATDEGGHTDFLITGENALLVPTRQPRQLASALNFLLSEEVLRRRMRERNRRKVQDLLIERTAEHYERLFARVCAQKDTAAVSRSAAPAQRIDRPIR